MFDYMTKCLINAGWRLIFPHLRYCYSACRLGVLNQEPRVINQGAQSTRFINGN